MKKIKIGLIGLGRIGKMHLQNLANLRDLFEVTAICDPYSAELVELAKQFNISYTTKDYRELLKHPDVEAVAIASATNTHAEIIMAAARAKKNIMCEKPVDTDVARIKEVLKVVADSHVKLQVGFNRRFDHNFHTIQKAVASGKLGEPQIIKISSRDPEPPSYDYIKVSGGLFNDMMIHDLDLIRFLSQSEVTEVYAKGAVLVDPEIGKLGDIDTAIVTLKFANGALGVIDNSRKAVYGYDQRAEVFGSKGQAFSENDKLSNVEIDLEDGGHLDKIPYFFIERYQQAYVAEFKEFYNCIVTDHQPLVTGLDGLRAVQLALACHQSLIAKSPVQLEY
ncbi:MAG: inositol 2-dehydrogenase [Liquorilactobacillus nagelii]|jgi:myo-inositol 2-dehydrogenase/D-chiro-inositol 1-dehydrogenase|uniref:inositol 2-dehydrogenase n=1 Tax=Liquorilactobacillus nagelii TaxID=82688 RepID=UPI002431A3A4|nr:inositol 2-dehydrogenase [Liquorilactobacillus nagelii]MCI1920920.1 inositol 2-dehydrogenase [Liquorilactobacillus nagelii]MCI1976574.1 inositol 2-dehydrogenase [Liquorilactobacillus nagelii]